MRRTSGSFLSAFVLLAVAATSPLHAQATRTFVSGVGNDANPCSRTAPCRTWAGAISKTARDGEISALDPGGYGAVTITKSITLNGDGTLASILHSAVQGVIVNITDAADTRKTVVLRSISLNGAGVTFGSHGISILAANQVTIDNVTIANGTGNAVNVALTGNGNVTVRNTRINQYPTGVRINTTSGLARVTLDNVSTDSLTNGVDCASNCRGVIRNSLFTRGSNGVLVSQGSGRVDLDNVVLSHNTGAGLAVNVSGATARLSRSGFFENGIGINIAAGGVVQSDGNNVFGGNTADGAPNGAALTKQ